MSTYLYGGFDCMLLSCNVRVSEWLYSCLNVKKLLARNRRDIWSLGDSNGIWTHNHLVRKRTLNCLGKVFESFTNKIQRLQSLQRSKNFRRFRVSVLSNRAKWKRQKRRKIANLFELWTILYEFLLWDCELYFPQKSFHSFASC